MTAEIYKELIKEAEGPTYLHIRLRLRLAVCLLSVTGVRINELLNIKISQRERFPINFLDNKMLPVTVFELVILPSYGKIPKILSLLSKQ